MLTLRIVEPEGDLHAGFAEVGPGVPELTLPIDVRLQASSDGALTDIRLAGHSLGAGDAGIERLRNEMRIVFPGYNPAEWQIEQKVTLRADDDLQYQYIVAAMSACSGDMRRDGSQTRLVKYPVDVVFR